MQTNNQCPIHVKGDCCYLKRCNEIETTFMASLADAAAKANPAEVAKATEAAIGSLESNENSIRLDLETASRHHGIPEPFAQILDNACVAHKTGLVGDILRFNYYRVYSFGPKGEQDLYGKNARKEKLKPDNGSYPLERYKKRIEYFFKVAAGKGQPTAEILNEGSEFVYRHVIDESADCITLMQHCLVAVPSQYRREVELGVRSLAIRDEMRGINNEQQKIAVAQEELNTKQQKLSARLATLSDQFDALFQKISEPKTESPCPDRR